MVFTFYTHMPCHNAHYGSLSFHNSPLSVESKNGATEVELKVGLNCSQPVRSITFSS